MIFFERTNDVTCSPDILEMLKLNGLLQFRDINVLDYLTVDETVLEKRRETSSQKHLTFVERQENLKGAFHVHKRSVCKGKNILLVDDVMTTGATGSETAALLLGAGAKRVIFLTGASLPERKHVAATTE